MKLKHLFMPLAGLHLFSAEFARLGGKIPAPPCRERSPIQNTRLRSALLAGLTVVIGFGATPALSAVPPPLGPVATVQRSDTPSFGIGVLRSLVRGIVQEVVNNTNATLQTQGKSARVSVGDVSAWSPYRTATRHVIGPINTLCVRHSAFPSSSVFRSLRIAPFTFRSI